MRERWPECIFVLDPEAGGETVVHHLQGTDMLAEAQRDLEQRRKDAPPPPENPEPPMDPATSHFLNGY